MLWCTYNIRLGIQQGLDALIEVLRPHAPDVVALQEVGRGWTMGPGGDSAAALAASLDLDHHHHVTTIAGPGGGGYGHALLSRWPLEVVEEVALPQVIDEPRRLLHAVIEAPVGPVRALTTHLSHREEDRPAQGAALVALAERLRGQGARVVIAGDLNTFGPAGWFDRLCADHVGADDALARPTYPACAPQARLDHLFASAGRWMGARVLEAPEASDHRPLLARWVAG